MSSRPGHESTTPSRARDLRNVGNELAGLASDLAEALRADWSRANGERLALVPGKQSTAVCIRYGQRLGELSLSTDRAATLINSEVDALHEVSTRMAHSRLAEIGSRAAFLLNFGLRTLMESRKDLADELGRLTSQHLEIHSTQPFRWHRFLFYLVPAILGLAAEGALAEDITRVAFRLRGSLWWIFPLALLTLPVVFKEALDWLRLDRLQKIYVGVLLALLLALMWPIASTRSEQAFSGSGRRAQSTIVDPFAPEPAGKEAQGLPPQQPSRVRAKVARPTFIFAVFGFLFPMVSGLCFYRAWKIADTGLESWHLGREIKATRKSLEGLDAQTGALRTELDSIQHQIIGLVSGLGPGDMFVEKMMTDLVGSLQAADRDAVEKLRQTIAGRGEEGPAQLAKRLALEVGALDHKGNESLHAHVRFQRDLLGSIAQIEEGDLLARISQALKNKALAALNEGRIIGDSAPFSVMDGHEPEELMRLIRQRKLRDALFRGKWSGESSEDGTEGEEPS